MSSGLSTTAPKPSGSDYAYAIVKGAISSIPFVPILPGVAAEVLSLIITSPMSKRQEEWITSIVQGLVDLQEKVEGYRLDNLSENESFVTTVLHATQIAIRNHQKEKIEALLNAVLRSTLPNPPEDYYQQIFMRLIDELTPLHLEVLRLLIDMKDRYEKLPQEGKNDFVYDFTDLQNYLGRHDLSDFELYQLIFKDLDSYRLANIHGLGQTGFHINFAMSRPTNLGEMFIRFITTPDILKK